jgi:aconitate hydratase
VVMGVLPIQFMPGQNIALLGLKGDEVFELPDMNNLSTNKPIQVFLTKPSGEREMISVIARLDSPIEVLYYRSGGILQYVLRNFLNKSPEIAAT